MPDLLKHLARMADAIIAVDGGHRVLLINRTTEALLGLTPPGSPWEALL
jgi:PAS domain-containing protein